MNQEHLINEGKILRCIVEFDQVSSMISWGPPGVDRTTLVRMIARQAHASFINFLVVTSGIREIRDAMKRTDTVNGIRAHMIVFIDEIHRFNKAQQNTFLSFVEKGTIILIGATTGNLSFEVDGALLSRCEVLVLKGLLEDETIGLPSQTLEESRGSDDQDIGVEDDLLRAIAVFSNGDARSAPSILEMVIFNGNEGDGVIIVTEEIVTQCTSRRSLLYDKVDKEYYNVISALHKSMRDSDPDSAIYWLAHMFESGENPVYPARRIMRFVAEDIGLTNANTLTVAINVFRTCHFIGMPKCTVHLVKAVIYLSTAPKSNSLCIVYEHTKKDALHLMAEPVPLVTRNAPTRLMKDFGYGENYRLAHNEEDKVAVDMQCLPDPLVGMECYTPTKEGHENHLRKHPVRLRTLRQGHQ